MQNKELLAQIAEMLEGQTKHLGEALAAHTRRIEAKIEHDITGRLDALTNGYKLTNEKLWELQRETRQMKSQIDNLQARCSALENQTA